MGWARLFDPAKVTAPGSSTPREDHASASALARRFQDRAKYGVKIETDAVWMRDPGRVKGSARPAPVSSATYLDIGNFQDAKLYKDVAFVTKTDYGDFNPTEATSLDLQPKIDAFSAEPKTAKGVYELSLAVSLHRNEGFEAHLRDKIAPAFFQAFPQGRIALVRSPYEYERRQGCVRGGYVAAQYGVESLTDEVNLKTLSRWSILAPNEQIRLTLDLGALAMYPVVPYFPTYRAGLTIVFVPGEKIEQIHPDFPVDWLGVYASRADFTKGGRRPTAAKVNDQTQSFGGHQRYLQDPKLSVDEICQWLDWLIERCGGHISWNTDPTGYLKDDLIDFVTCFEHGLTIDRLLRKAIASNTAAQRALRIGATFEVADIIEELTNYWTETRNSERFKTLFNPIDGLDLLKRALATAPGPWRDLLEQGADAVYSALRDTVIGSITMPDKNTGAGVLVRNSALTSEVLETYEVFTANVLRSLRNTHHGYMTAQDRQARPSRYLALVTGELPDQVTYIGVLAGLAYLADPTVMVERPAYAAHQFD